MARLTVPVHFRRYVLFDYKNKRVDELAELFQVTPMTIYNWLKREKLGRLDRPRSNGVDKGKIRELLGDGRKIMEICGIVGCSNTVVKKVKREMRLEGKL